MRCKLSRLLLSAAFGLGLSAGTALSVHADDYRFIPQAPAYVKPSCPAPGMPAPIITPQPAPRPGEVQPAPQPGEVQPAPAPAVPADTGLAQAAPQGTAGPSGFNPTMLGDQPSSSRCDPIVAFQRGSVRTPLALGGTFRVAAGDLLVLGSGRTVPATDFAAVGEIIQRFRLPPGCLVNLPYPVAGGFKIADNESPRPMDRVFGTYNFYNQIAPSTDLHRESIGFEKTLLGGNASVGLRLPFFQLDGDPSLSDSEIGDLTIITKVALLNDPASGNVLCGGLAVTVPTGKGPEFFGLADIHPTLLQPYGGGIFNLGDLYVQGFTSLVVPTDSRDVIYLFNDLGVGYWLYRNNAPGCWVSFLIPTVEVHVTTPLRNRGSEAEPVGGIDLVDLTGGVQIGLGKSAFLNLGAVTPVTGPRPFDIEALAQLNFRF